MTDQMLIAPDAAPAPALDTARDALLRALEAEIAAFATATAAHRAFDAAAAAWPGKGAASAEQTAEAHRILTAHEQALLAQWDTRAALDAARAAHRAAFLAAGCPVLPARIGTATLPLLLTSDPAGYGGGACRGCGGPLIGAGPYCAVCTQSREG